MTDTHFEAPNEQPIHRDSFALGSTYQTLVHELNSADYRDMIRRANGFCFFEPNEGSAHSAIRDIAFLASKFDKFFYMFSKYPEMREAYSPDLVNMSQKKCEFQRAFDEAYAKKSAFKARVNSDIAQGPKQVEGLLRKLISLDE